MKNAVLSVLGLFVFAAGVASPEIPNKEDAEHVETAIAKLIPTNFEPLTERQAKDFPVAIRQYLEQYPKQLDRKLIDKFLSAFTVGVHFYGSTKKYCDEDYAINVARLKERIGFFIERFTMTDAQREQVKGQAKELIEKSEPALRELLSGLDEEPFARYWHEIARLEGPFDIKRNLVQRALNENRWCLSELIEAMDNPAASEGHAMSAFTCFLCRPLTDEEMQAIWAEWERRIAELMPVRKRYPEWKEKLEKIFKEETDPEARRKKLDFVSFGSRPEERENSLWFFIDEKVPVICAAAGKAVPPPPQSAELKAALEAAEEAQRKRIEERNKKEKEEKERKKDE